MSGLSTLSKAGDAASRPCPMLQCRGHVLAGRPPMPVLPAPPQVICLDNFFTGSKDNIAHLLDKENFELIRHDVSEG